MKKARAHHWIVSTLWMREFANKGSADSVRCSALTNNGILGTGLNACDNLVMTYFKSAEIPMAVSSYWTRYWSNSVFGERVSCANIRRWSYHASLFSWSDFTRVASILQSRCCEALSSLDQFPIAGCHCDRVMHRQKKRQDRLDRSCLWVDAL